MVSGIAGLCRDASGVGQFDPVDCTVRIVSTWAFNTTINTLARRLPRARDPAVFPLHIACVACLRRAGDALKRRLKPYGRRIIVDWPRDAWDGVCRTRVYRRRHHYFSVVIPASTVG